MDSPVDWLPWVGEVSSRRRKKEENVKRSLERGRRIYSTPSVCVCVCALMIGYWVVFLKKWSAFPKAPVGKEKEGRIYRKRRRRRRKGVAEYEPVRVGLWGPGLIAAVTARNPLGSLPPTSATFTISVSFFGPIYIHLFGPFGPFEYM